MESPKPVSVYSSQSSKKRVFPGGNDVEILEITPPPITRSSKGKSSKQKEKVIYHEIIDVDLIEDCGNTDRSRKGKKVISHEIIDVDLEEDRVNTDRSRKHLEALSNLSPGVAKASGGSGSKKKMSKKVFNSNLFYGDEDWIDRYADDIIFEEPDALPVEAPFALLPGYPQNNIKVPVTDTTTGSGLKRSTTSRSKKRSHSSSNVYSNLHNQNGTSPVWPDNPLNGLGPSVGPSVVTTENALTSSTQDSVKNQNEAPSVGAVEENVDEITKNSYNFKKFDTVEDFSDHHYANGIPTSKYAQKNWAKRIQEEWKILENDLPDTIFVRVYESRMDLLRAVIIGAEGTPYHDGLFFFDVQFPNTYPNVPPRVNYHSGGLRINPNLYNCGKVCLSLLNTWPGGPKESWIPGVSTILQVLVSIQGLILNAKPYFNEPGYAGQRESRSSLDYDENTFIYNLQTMTYSMRKPPKHFEPLVVSYFCQHARDILKSCKTYLEGAQVGSLLKGGVKSVTCPQSAVKSVTKKAKGGVKGVATIGGSCSPNFKIRLAGFIATLVNAFTQIGAKDCQEFLPLSQTANGAATAGILPPYSYY